MGRKKAAKSKGSKEIKCKNCKHSFLVGSDEDKETRGKEWTNVAPMPDKDGNVTITLMAVWTCSNCGKTIRGSAGKTKGDFAGKSKKVQIDEKLAENLEFSITEFATSIGVNEDNLLKIVNKQIETGKINGTIKDGVFYPN